MQPVSSSFSHTRLRSGLLRSNVLNEPNMQWKLSPSSASFCRRRLESYLAFFGCYWDCGLLWILLFSIEWGYCVWYIWLYHEVFILDGGNDLGVVVTAWHGASYENHLNCIVFTCQENQEFSFWPRGDFHRVSELDLRDYANAWISHRSVCIQSLFHDFTQDERANIAYMMKMLYDRNRLQASKHTCRL